MRREWVYGVWSLNILLMTKAKFGQHFLHVILETIPRDGRVSKEELMACVDGSFEKSVAWRVIGTQDPDWREIISLRILWSLGK